MQQKAGKVQSGEARLRWQPPKWGFPDEVGRSLEPADTGLGGYSEEGLSTKDTHKEEERGNEKGKHEPSKSRNQCE